MMWTESARTGSARFEQEMSKRGGRYCAAGGPNNVSCTNNSNTPGVSMHIFPKDESVRRRWTRLCGSTDETLSPPNPLLFAPFTSSQAVTRGYVWAVWSLTPKALKSKRSEYLRKDRCPPSMPPSPCLYRMVIQVDASQECGRE